MHHSIDADVMVIIEDHDERLFDRLEDLVHQQVGSPFGKLDQVFLCLGEVWNKRLAERRHGRADALGKITEENSGIGIRVVKLVPDDRALERADKIRDQRRFSAACVGGNYRYRSAQVLRETFGQPRPVKDLGDRPRGQQLGAKKEVRVLHEWT